MIILLGINLITDSESLEESLMFVCRYCFCVNFLICLNNFLYNILILFNKLR